MKTSIKFFIALMAMALMAGLFSSCDNKKNSDQILGDQQEATMDEANAQIGFPGVNKFTQKKLFKQIFELCDQADLICYAYLYNEMQGKVVFMGKCAGYGIPFSTQYTNPENLKKFIVRGGYEYHVVPQADPNGLFMPTTSNATWVILQNPFTGDLAPLFCEPNLIISPWPLDYINNPETLKKTEIDNRTDNQKVHFAQPK